MKKLEKYAFRSLLFLLCACFAACRSIKHATKETEKEVITSQTAIVSRVNDNRQTAKGIRAKLSLSLTAAGRSASVGGSIKMKRDEIIQLSLTAFGLLEIGRMEMTPQYLLIQDRVNKQYMRAYWDDVPTLKQAGISFQTFQAIFWNELFVPGKTYSPSDKDFSTMRLDDSFRLTPADGEQRDMNVQFLVQTANYLIGQTDVSSPKARNVALICRYDNWAELEHKNFPTSLKLTIQGGTKQYVADMNLSRLQADEQMGNITTNVSANYKQVTLDDIMKVLTGKQ